jgi:hypothetical protein
MLAAGKHAEAITYVTGTLGAPIHQAGRAGQNLLVACVCGPPEGIKPLIQGGMDANCTVGTMRRTPLMVAAALLKTEAVQQLLECKANPNVTDAKGSSALFYIGSHETAGVMRADRIET